MNKLYVMVGLPASGKSTIAAEYVEQHGAVLVSSDAIRTEIYGDENCQDNPSKVFDLMKKRTVAALREGHDVVYDATNINSKRRISLLRDIKNQVAQFIPVAVLVLCPVDECIERDALRDRTVGKAVINKMLCNYQPPSYYEGFTTLEYHYTGNYLNIEELLGQTWDFDQKNHHHTLSLGNHMSKTAALVEDDFMLNLAARYHDIGKLFVQTFDEDGEAHYKNHHHVGAYTWLCSALARDWMFNDMSYAAQYVAQLICWHMQPYFVDSYEDFVEWGRKRGMKPPMIDDIWKLHCADLHAH